MLERGTRGAAPVRGLGCGAVVVMMSLTGVTEGQVRVGHPLEHTSAGKGDSGACDVHLLRTAPNLDPSVRT